MNLAIGIDLGGTKIDIGLVSDKGTLLDRKRIPTRVEDGPEKIVLEIANTIKEVAGKQNYDGVGIGIAGQIENKSGKVLFAPNLGWKNFELQKTLSRLLKMDVKVTNDVRAATWGEWLYGAGTGATDLICLFVGTGIGGGVVCDGKILNGFSNTAGEFGHMTIDLHGPTCSCGNRGCFEALASGWAIAKRAKEIIAYDHAGGIPLLDMVDGNIDQIGPKQVFASYLEGSPIAKKIVFEISEALIAGVSNLVNAFNPERIVLGGSIMLQEQIDLVAEIAKGVPQRALKAAVHGLTIMKAKLGADAGIIGAAAYAMKEDQWNKK